MFLRPVDELEMRWVASVVVWCSVVGQIVIAIPEAVRTGRITWYAQGENVNAHAVSMVGIPLVLLFLLWVIRCVSDERGRKVLWVGVLVSPGIISGINIISGDAGTGSYAHYFFVGTLAALFFSRLAAWLYMVWVAVCSLFHSMTELVLHIALSRWIAFLVVFIGGSLALMAARESQARTAAALRERSEIDPLTQCFTRARFVQDLAEVLDTDTRAHDTRSALVLFDVDYFKSINDCHGHIVGDLVLREMGKVLRGLPKEVRSYRLGGDEFAVIAPCGDLQSANSLADAVVTSFAERSAAMVTNCNKSVSSSYGTTLIDETQSPWSLYAEADQILYEAKRRRPATTVAAPKEVSDA